MELDEHFFRREAGRMIATLTRLFGVQNLALAEDVVQDAFCRALEVWKLHGAPENPSAWLMTTAKNRALDLIRRERTARVYTPEMTRLIEAGRGRAIDDIFEPNAIQDAQLRMMFSCCDPRLSEEAQVALALHILCGFSVDEIASAFVSTHSAIEKRISRSKKTLAESKHLFDFSGAGDFPARLSSVQRSLYLLFNEGYHGASPESAVRADLCHEAMRLAALLLEHSPAATPETYALSSLMCFHAARLPARVDSSGNLRSLFEQDRSCWDTQLVIEGRKLLDLSATGPDLTAFHIEAAIASVHADAGSTEDTDWGRIVSLYDKLMEIRPSPVVALNRAIAVAQKQGPERGLDEIRAIPNRERLAKYPFYFAALGQIELSRSNPGAARDHFEAAHALARNEMERRYFDRRADACDDRANHR